MKTTNGSFSMTDAVGQPLQQLLVAVANDGPTEKGIRIRFSGDTLAEGFITLAEVNVIALVTLGGGLSSDRRTYTVRRDEQG